MTADGTVTGLPRSTELPSDRPPSRGRLSSGVAHDFNNLLTAILGFSALLAEDLQADPQKHKLIEKVIASAEKARSLIHQTLTVVRTDAAAPEGIDAGSETLPERRRTPIVDPEAIRPAVGTTVGVFNPRG